MTRISLITVCYNSEATLAETLKSVSNQTVLPFEHIVVDGGSVDGTCDILAHWGGHPLKWSSQPDHGIYDAMNRGLTRATGDVVGFINADDVFADNLALAAISDTMEHSRSDAVFGNLVYVAKNDPRRIIRFWDASGFAPTAFRHGVMPPHPTLYMRRSRILSHGGFRLDLDMASDFEFCVRHFVRHRLSYRHIPRILIKMRLGGESNKSWRNILHQNLCIQRALRLNRLSPHPLYPLLKTLDKGRQFIAKPPTTVIQDR